MTLKKSGKILPDFFTLYTKQGLRNQPLFCAKTGLPVF